MGDLVERLTMQIKVGMLGMPKGMSVVNFKDCLAEITHLRAALADAHAVGFAAGVEAAKTAVSLNAWKHGGDDAYSVGMDVGARQQNEQDLAAIRALTPPDLTAAAARLLPEKLFNAQINDACLSFRHDFGLMNDQKQASLQAEAGWWWTAFRRAIAGDNT